MIPHQTPFFLPWLYPSLTWRIAPEKKDLYLTFDDGPVTGPTEFVLSQLSAASIKATFFCIGDNIRKHPEVFQQITAAAHSIGNHTVNHLNGWKTSPDKYISNVRDFESIAEAEGCKGRIALFRPPYGRITRKQISALSDYRIVMWDVLSQDYNQRLSKENCLMRTARACRPGSIIVFHDSYKSEANLKYVLPRLIDYCLRQGYAFKPI